tara:strand:+ start:988 stop:1152 length:165 start_codon:yes stop_codon:yes gene_type:complete
MKIEYNNDKGYKIVINGVTLHQDDIYKMLAYLQRKQPIEKVYKNAINRLKKNVK